jgi:quinoprotein glucose dehydrogenase/quinate dehydrogenase (quinone)
MTWIFQLIRGTVLAYGVALVWLGLGLLELGGSPYYAIAGIGTVVAAALTLARRRRAAMIVYLAVLLYTLGWAYQEAGLHVWLVLPRLGLPLLAGILLCLPIRLPQFFTHRGIWAVAATAVLAVVVALPRPVMTAQAPRTERLPPQDGVAASQPAADASRWVHYGNDLGGTRFSAASEITPANVGSLQLAWHVRTGEDPAKSPDARNLPAFEATPLRVDGKLILCTPRNQVIALDERTGAELWRHDPQTQLRGNFYLVTCRGVAYFEAPPAARDCRKRIIGATLDSRLFALDADTGKPCSGFGTDGTVSLRERIGDIPPGFYGVTSAPTVAGGLVIVGGLVLDNQSVDVPSGVVRAFDAVTGRQRWAWDSGRPGNTSLAAGEVYTRGSPNAWAPFSADEHLGLVYIPTGNASPDYFGGERSADKERYASSVVALDLQTGAVRWSFQTVHHDLWDYDVASQPSLVDLPGAQGSVPALVQTTKRGEIFVLDRRSGVPLHGIEERQVPQGAVAGDRTAATQPYATGMPSLAPEPLSEARMWGVTPFDQIWCRKRFLQARYEGAFTPPSELGSISFPNNMGVSNWGGLSIDPVRGVAIANTSYVASTITLYTRDKAQRREAEGTPVYNPQQGTPYAVDALPLLSPLGIPCNAPPWGLLSAIDLKAGRLLWQQPFGTTAHRMPFGLAVPLGMPSSGGSLVTTTGITFIGAADDGLLRAYETSTGRLLWSAQLPAAANATPMSYVAADGRQYIVVAAGGHTYLGTARGDHVLAFALPTGQPPAR